MKATLPPKHDVESRSLTPWLWSAMIVTGMLAFGASLAAQTQSQSASETQPASSISLPGAPPEGLFLDYLAVDRERHRVWVPAGGSGNTVVIDTKTHEVHTIGGFTTAEVERRGQKRKTGPTAASVGQGVVYIGNRGDSSICAVDASSLELGGCVTLESTPDGVAFVGKSKEVWVTTPRTSSIAILDVTQPKSPKLAGNITLEGSPEGYAVDDERGFFYTNLEDKDKTLRIDVSTRKVAATWEPSCGEEGPRGLALDPTGHLLMVACTDRVEVLAAGKDGRIVSKLGTGAGVDALDYLPALHSLYAAASGAATMTVAHVDKKGMLSGATTVATAKGARNAVVDEDGTAYVADGPEGKILIMRPASR